MSKETNIRELALEVSSSLDEASSQEKLAAAVTLLKKNKETRDEFSSICHEVVDACSSDENSERVLFLFINSILYEAKEITTENESPQPTETISSFCKDTCNLIVKGSVDHSHVLIKRAIIFFKKTVGKEKSGAYFISKCFMDTARLPPQQESNILFIPALILAKNIHNMTTKFHKKNQSHHQDEQATIQRDFADLVGRRLFSAGSGVPALSHSDITRGNRLLRDLSKEDFDLYIVRSLKVKLMSFPEDTIVTLTAFIEIMTDMGLGDYFEGHLEGNTKLVKTVVSKFLRSDDEDIRKRGSTLLIALMKACPRNGITVVAQAIADAFDEQEKSIEGLSMCLENAADYFLELKGNNKGQMSWEILAKKTVLPALEKVDNEITQSALSKWKIIAGSISPGVVASSEPVKLEITDPHALQNSAAIIACHEKNAGSISPGVVGSLELVKPEITDPHALRNSAAIIACYEKNARTHFEEKKANFQKVKVYQKESSSEVDTDINSLENGELDINYKDDSFKDRGDPASPIDRGDFTDNPYIPNDTGGLAVAVKIVDGEGSEGSQPPLPEAEKYDPTKIPEQQKKIARFKILLTIFVIIIVAVIVTVTIIFTKKSDHIEKAPTPTMQPTSVAELLMKQKLETISMTNKTLFDDSGTPYNKAYKWMSSDEISLDAMMNKPNDDVLRERFALAHFYFAMTKNSNWTLCSHYSDGMPVLPGENETICNFIAPLQTKGEAYVTKTYNTRWLSNSDVCLWGGVFCHNEEIISDSFIGSIEMLNNNLQGTISEQIGLLHSLNILLLTNNRISGSIPAGFENFTDFFSFRVSNNNLKDDLEKIFQFTTLVELDVSTNQFYGTISTEIGLLRQIRFLFLSNNTLTGSIPTEIGKLNRLDYFSTEQNPKMNGTLPMEVGNMVSLNELRLENSGLYGTIPTEVGKLREIQKLILENNRFSGNIPDSIYDLSSLKRLYLGKNRLNGTLAHKIGNLSSLEIIHVDTNKLTGQIPTEIGKLIKLQNGLFHRNYFNGTMPSEICTERSILSSLLILAADCRARSNIPEIECDNGCCNVCCDRNDTCYKET